jgi:uncharacterized protein YprB with RNaseH-like and TPR domain
MNSAELNKILFLDIETIPQVYKYNELAPAAKELWDKKFLYNKELGPEKQYEKAGIYAEFAKVLCIGLGFYNEGKFRVKCLASENERELLQQFSDLLAKHFSHSSNVLCAHNGKEFDFPFLCRRFIINRLPLPKILQIQNMKPWEVQHIDTLDLWKFGDYKNFTSLNLLAHVLGVPSPKDDIDGSLVAKTFYEEKGLDRIQKYCMKDVITLARVYKRFGGEGDLPDDEIIFV